MASLNRRTSGLKISPMCFFFPVGYHQKYSCQHKYEDTLISLFIFFFQHPWHNKEKRKWKKWWNIRMCDCVISSCVQSPIPSCWMTDCLLASCIKPISSLFHSLFSGTGGLNNSGGAERKRGVGGGIGCQLIASLRGDYVLIEKTTDNYGSRDGSTRERLPNRHGGHVGPGLIITTETDLPPSPQQPL